MKIFFFLNILVIMLPTSCASVAGNGQSRVKTIMPVHDIYSINQQPVSKDEFDRLFANLRIIEEIMSGEMNRNGSLAGFNIFRAVDSTGKFYSIKDISGLTREIDISPENKESP